MTPASPPASLYTMSDDEEDDYSTIARTTSSRGVKLLYSKSKVYIHPSPSAKDNIAGYIALLQQKPSSTERAATSTPSSAPQSQASSSLLLAWVPETSLGDARDLYVKVDMTAADAPPTQSYLVPPPPTTTHSSSVGNYAFAIPVSNIYSLLIRPPNLGWWFGSLIVNTRAGDSFPALFFHDSECESTILQKKRRTKESFDPFGEGGQTFWGGDEVLRWLRRYVTIERSGAEPNIFLVEPSAEDKHAFGDASTNQTISTGRSPGTQVGGAAGSGSRDAAMDPVTKFVKETGWNIMNQFSKVTQLARRTAEDVSANPKIPPQVRRLLKNPEVNQIQEEFDSARIYLARWALGIQEQSERDKNQRIWTARDVLEMEETDVGDFELLDTEMHGLSLAAKRKTVTLKEWKGYFDSRTGRLSVTVDEVKERIFHGGLDPDDGVRKEAWLFLLGVHDWHSSSDERKVELASMRDEYVRLKSLWWNRLEDLGGEGPQGEWFREQRNRIEKDVHRTDRNIPLFAGEDTPHPDPDSPFADVGTNVHLEQLKDMLLTYNEYNKDLGYVQGMSDLLAPIYAVIQDDAAAFWCFSNFMERMERNFLRDQSGMKNQLLSLDHLVRFMDPKLYTHLESADSTNFFFFFRMILVWYKREFGWTDILHLWEVFWTDYLSSSFHLFVALAILEKHRDVMMDHLKHFDEVLKYVNELSTTIDLETTLVRAEALFRRYARTVEAIDKKQNFPAPKVRQRLPTSRSSEDTSTSVTATGTASASGTSAGKAPVKDNVVKGKGLPSAQEEEGDSQEVKKAISPELRTLLSRKVEILPRRVVKKSGEGLNSVKK